MEKIEAAVGLVVGAVSGTGGTAWLAQYFISKSFEKLERMGEAVTRTKVAIQGIMKSLELFGEKIELVCDKLEKVSESVIKIQGTIDGITKNLGLVEKDRKILHRHDKELAILNHLQFGAPATEHRH